MTSTDTMHIESPHRLVLASAGSGKTYQLTNVFLRLLLLGAEPSGLLATTFTRAAAGEILNRSLARLSDAVVDEAALGELRNAVDVDLTRDQCATTLERVVGAFHRLSVMTIDAFFSRLASSFSYELGVAAGWRMLDDEVDAKLRAQAVERAMEGASEPELLELLRDLQGDKPLIATHQSIMDVVDQGYAAYLETLGDETPWRAIKPAGHRLDTQAIERAADALRNVDLPLTKTGKPRKRWVTSWEQALDLIRAGDWEGFATLTLVLKIITGEAEYDRGVIEDSHRKAMAPLIDHARFLLTKAHAQRTIAAYELLKRFDCEYCDLKRAQGGMTFADPPRLLLEAQTTRDLTHLYYRLDATIDHLLLDEFQDTSMTQFRILEPILDELLSQAAEGRSVFCVGDVKQSLYAWRQAEPALLGALPHHWSALNEETLATSWRSAPSVLDGVNAIFTDAQGNPAMQSSAAALEAAKHWDDRFEAHLAAHKDLTGSVRLIVADDPEITPTRPTERNRAALETAADRVKCLRQRAPGASIAVLLRRGADVSAVLRMLKRRGVDASERRGNPLVDAPPVAAAASMLRLIDHPGHTAALYHVATSPLGEVVGLPANQSLSDQSAGVSPLSLLPPASVVRSVAAEYRLQIARVGCANVLGGWLDEAAPFMDVQGAVRFEQFIALAQEFDALGQGGPSELAAIAESRKIDQPGAAPVRVMTIHGAKGLEFDVVVVPLVGSQSWRIKPGGVLMARDEPLGPVTKVSRSPNQTLQGLDPDLAALHQYALQRQINEELCCLYVATTRAKRCLEIVVPADAVNRNEKVAMPAKWGLRPSHFVRAALAPESLATPGATLWSSGEIDDWIDNENVQGATTQPEPIQIVELKTRASRRRSAACLAVVSPSQSPDGATVLADTLLKRGDPAARTRGELMHLWFEQIDWIETSTPDDAALLDAAARAGHDERFSRAHLEMFRQAMASDSIQSALSRSTWSAGAAGGEETRVYCERSFAVRVSSVSGERLLQGRFDRLVVGRVEGRAVRAQIVDYKTDQGAAELSADDLARYAERHRPQMEAYRRAASRLLSLPMTNVEVVLVFTAAGQAVALVSASNTNSGEKDR